ncbi:phytanoyl-CoA dioxygenase family protein [Novosphingobium bradum]|uniref:Phytanoyl-CoA dioxygenase family protein n=1 Tax=Novosphingobium bradum TaxID=1737444 RepID=A0ABV7IQZ6_9SPHN
MMLTGAPAAALAGNVLPGIPPVESPLFERLLPEMGLSAAEQEVARQLNTRGYAVIDFPDAELDARIERITADLAPRFGIDPADAAAPKAPGHHRIQDAWQFQPDVGAIAANGAVLSLLSRLYGRRAFPFQTLNFPVGTQQALHSDAAHFSSQPERFMCGVWVALEDIRAEAGPLNYLPGSHRWPIITNAMVGRRGWQTRLHSAQDPFEAAWQAQAEASGTAPETFLARKGQALIWAANLLHGGSPQTDPTLTRWSQVTHYYFEDCLYYTPAFSDEPLGLLDLRAITDIATGELVPNRLLGEAVLPQARAVPARRKASWLKRLLAPARRADLPEGWDPQAYLALNPDVAAAGDDPLAHFEKHGRAEGRRYRA